MQELNSNYTDLDIDPYKIKTLTLKEIYEIAFPPRNEIIRGLLYRGTYILAGSPKSGKSFLAEQIAFHVATGQDMWGNEVKQGRVLILSLEDTYSRLQSRYWKMFGDFWCADKLHFSTFSLSIEDGLIKSLNKFVNENKDTSLIIIDTLQKVREANSNYNYSKDYEIISLLKNFADQAGICLLLVHHTRKMKAENVFDMISGTSGIFGCVDGAFVLEKDIKNTSTAYLSVSGRDQPDQRIKLKRNKTNLCWDFVEAQSDVFEDPKDSILDAVAGFINSENPKWEGTATDLKEILSLEINPNSLSRHLNVYISELRERKISYVNKRTHDGRKIILEYTD